MNWFIDGCIWISKLARPHLATLSLALVATCLVLAGDSINRYVKRHLGRAPFAIRVLTFSCVCTLGYGTLIVVAVPFVRQQLAGLSNTALSPVLAGLFLVIGWIAEQKKYI